ncbi:glycosyltransferase family 4 protein [Brachybacterium sp. AOP43-C2-M15]|uniref:glycosyltransferase family 4 protein n=1 Tax=Brachybacterium sp. AOP43-C2-M15 TaxID=3457661 RepID=UPI004033FEB2
MNLTRMRPGPRTTTDQHRPLRVLLTTDWWEPVVNGVVASVQTLRRELIALGCEVRVLTLSQGFRTRHEPGVYRIGSVSAGMVYDRARIGMPGNRRMLRDILRWGPDVIHSQCEFSTYVWAKRIARTLSVPLVHTYHTIYEDYTHYYSPSRTVGRKVVASFSRHALAGTDAVIVPTAKVSRLLSEYGVRRPVQVIPTGLDLQRFRPAADEAERADARALRARLGIDPGQTVLLSVCRLAKEKNLDEVLDMVAAADRRDAVLVLVGGGPYRTELEERARSLGIEDRVRFAGVVEPSEVQRWYRMGDVFVGASLSETQGLTFIEALACGLPLLCRRDPSLSSVVVEGRTGWQFEDAAQFTEHLSALLDDPRRRGQMARAAVEHARATCGAAEFGRRVLDVYQQVRRGRSPRIIGRQAVAA